MTRKSSPSPGDGTAARRLAVQRIRVNAQGYDSGGSYWGAGHDVFIATTPDGAEEITVRARNVAEAREKVAAELARRPGETREVREPIGGNSPHKSRYEIDWGNPVTNRTVRIRITHAREYLFASSDHLQIESIDPKRRRYPSPGPAISRTSYPPSLSSMPVGAGRICHRLDRARNQGTRPGPRRRRRKRKAICSSGPMRRARLERRGQAGRRRQHPSQAGNRTRQRSRMTLTRSQRRAQGAAAEDHFRAWLDRCVLPHMYVEQSPLTVPKSLKGEIKRPDFLVGIPTIGTLAFDVKAKTVYENSIIIDEYEHRTFKNFETFFNMRVWYACFPPDEPTTCHLVPE